MGDQGPGVGPRIPRRCPNRHARGRAGRTADRYAGPQQSFGDNPISQGKSILSHDEPIPEDQFIDDDIIAEMEKADMETVETLRQITKDAEEDATAEAALTEETGGALEDLARSPEPAEDDGAAIPSASPKTTADS